ncbi:MAG: L,D-transpeptidase [Deltaproteobacteria bacterium]|nr:L,D-transpeptidase [Deltaproteobacteria bacterium]
MPVTGDAQSSAVVPTPDPVSWLRIELNIPAREVRLIDHDKVVGSYPVAIGQMAYKSIVMSSQLNRIEWNPWWYPPSAEWAADDVVTPPGPKNPLGRVKLPLSRAILIHGTNAERSVGRAASHGCFRMLNKDAVALAWYLQERLSDKTDPALLDKYAKQRRTTFIVPLAQPVPVEILYEPIVLLDNVLYLYPDTYGKVRNWHERIAAALQAAGIDSSPLSPERIKELRRQLQRGKIEISVTELLRPPDPPPAATLSKAE